MKKFIIVVALLIAGLTEANAMSTTRARAEALFLTDKMAYELSLTDEQYNAVYEINFDYFASLIGESDIFGIYWNRRDRELGWVLTDWQYRVYLQTEYFIRPVVYRSNNWHFVIYDRYAYNRFYRPAPVVYRTYRYGTRHYHNTAHAYRNYNHYHHNVAAAHKHNNHYNNGYRDNNNRNYNNGTRHNDNRNANVGNGNKHNANVGGSTRHSVNRNTNVTTTTRSTVTTTTRSANTRNNSVSRSTGTSTTRSANVSSSARRTSKNAPARSTSTIRSKSSAGSTGASSNGRRK